MLNFVLNTLLSLHMVIAFLVAVILDNTLLAEIRLHTRKNLMWDVKLGVYFIMERIYGHWIFLIVSFLQLPAIGSWISAPTSVGRKFVRKTVIVSRWIGKQKKIELGLKCE
ncbi:hypothetical protein OROMI_015326 [Orobanche minor]